MSQKPISDAKPHLIRSYGRRKSKGMRPARVSALDEILSRVSILPSACPRAGGDPVDVAARTGPLPSQGHECVEPRSFFNFPVKQVWLEIGFGNGEHLLQQALDNPDIGMIGCEPFINGVAALCVAIKANHVENIRIWPDDARLLMEKIKPESLDRLFLLHPDPWPKTRHHKRRFVQTETLDEFARLLKSGAEFRTATDHSDLAAWMLGKLNAHPAFRQNAAGMEDGPETRYGQKGLKQGRPPVYLSFQRKE
jgi:tRNA (guanine-N7-)-methyltransferase